MDEKYRFSLHFFAKSEDLPPIDWWLAMGCEIKPAKHKGE